MRELILGGARSGKSGEAEHLARTSGLDVVYVATASVGDAEMERRVETHRLRRPEHWSTVEAPLQLASVLKREARRDRCILIDCLTLWITNALLEDEQGTTWREERSAFLETVAQLPGYILMVSNEVGWGIVPMGELNRRFVDEAGLLHQELAQLCDRVTLTVAGLPLRIKG